MNFLRLLGLSMLMEEGDAGGDGGAAAAAAAKAAAKSQPETFSREYVHELREENKSWRTKHQESETARKTADDAAKAATKAATDAATAAEAAAETKIKDANTAAEKRIIRAELKAVAIKAGIVDIDGLSLADLSAVKLNDAGEVEGAEALIEALKKAKPYLFGTQSTSSTHKPPPVGDIKPKKAQDMTPDEYRAARAALS
jgi:hypothetical protein